MADDEDRVATPLSRRSLLGGALGVAATVTLRGGDRPAGSAGARHGWAFGRRPASGRDRPASARPAQSGTALLRIGTMSPSPGIDPFSEASGTLNAALYDCLTAISPSDNSVGGNLARSVRRLSATTLELAIDPRAVFSDGSAVSASDAAFSLRRALAAQSPLSALLAGVSDIAVAADGTLHVTTSAPDPLLERRLASVPIVSAAAYSSVPAGNPPRLVGSGRFVLSGFSAGSSFSLSASANSWAGQPAAPALSVVEAVTAEELLGALLGGRLQLAQDLPPSALADLGGDVEVSLAAPGTASYLVLQSSTGPFADIRARLAVATALDAGQLVAGVLGGAGTPLGGQLGWPGVAGYSPSLAPVETDARRSRQLLAAAGHRDGLETILAGWSGQAAMLQAVAAQLSAVGVRASVVELDTTAWLRAVRAGSRYPILLAQLDVAPLFDLGPVYSSLSGLGVSGFVPVTSNAELERLDAAQAVELDAPRRAALLGRLAALVRDDLVVVPLCREQWIYGRLAGVSGLSTSGPDLLLSEVRASPS